MKTTPFVQRNLFPFSVERVFAWHERAGAFERYNPPWDPARIIRRVGTIHDGDETELSIRMGPFRKRWLARHQEYIPGRQFRDIQVRGPFAKWEHTHLVEPAGPNQAYLEDRIDYVAPLGALGRLLGGRSIRRMLDAVFAYRHRVLYQDLWLHQRYPVAGKKILISGATGLVGSALGAFLSTGGAEVYRLSRTTNPNDAKTLTWDPAKGMLDAAPLEGLDAVIHLAGENIAGGRWTKRRKAAILASRVEGTQLLAKILQGLKTPPRTFLTASAIGYYGHRGDEIVDEGSAPGTGFLSEVCQAWEAAAKSLVRAETRTAFLRFGVILSPAGGALAKMITPFRMGVGGKVGSGRQTMSWIALDDVLGAIAHVLHHTEQTGPINFVSPNPVDNRTFTKTLGSVIWRPTIIPMPGFMARLAFGEMANELLLASTRVRPTRLLETGYSFLYPDLHDALMHLLGKSMDSIPAIARQAA